MIGDKKLEMPKTNKERRVFMASHGFDMNGLDDAGVTLNAWNLCRLNNEVYEKTHSIHCLHCEHGAFNILSELDEANKNKAPAD